LKEQDRGQANQKEGPSAVWRHLRSIEQTQEQSKIQQQNEQGSDKPLFFGEGGEYRICMGYRDESQPTLRSIA
jgi:hypothetical protein